MWKWLGGRDSNPDTVVQSHVSYRWTTSQYQRGARVRLQIIDSSGYEASSARSTTLVPGRPLLCLINLRDANRLISR